MSEIEQLMSLVEAPRFNELGEVLVGPTKIGKPVGGGAGAAGLSYLGVPGGSDYNLDKYCVDHGLVVRLAIALGARVDVCVEEEQ